MLTDPKDIREGHKLRGRGRGPWRITTLLQDAVHLKCAFTGRELLDVHGMRDPINTDRLMRFSGDINDLELAEVADQLTLRNAQEGSYVAIVNAGRVLLLKIVEVEEEVAMTGYPLMVPKEERYGAAARRPWKIDVETQLTIRWDDVLCLVELDETGCMTYGSLERLRRLGLEVDGGPQNH